MLGVMSEDELRHARRWLAGLLAMLEQAGYVADRQAAAP
jgi:hypothetical protein